MALMIPAVAGPLSELSQSVRVQGQRPDAFVTVFSRSMAEVVAQGIAASADERLPLLPGVTLHRGNLLFAVQEVEGVHSARPSGDLGQAVGAGATSLHGDGPISEQILVLTTNAVVTVQPVLRADDDIYVQQWACSDVSHPSATEPVVAAPGIGPVDVLGMLHEGSSEVHVRGALPGGAVDVFATPQDGAATTFVGRAWPDSLHPVLVVPANRPIVQGDTVSARQVFCGHPSEGGGLEVRADRAPQHGPRPFYVFAHNPNSLSESFEALGNGANALEPDVNVYDDASHALCIAEAGLSGNVKASTDSPALADYLRGLHHFAEIFPQSSLS